MSDQDERCNEACINRILAKGAQNIICTVERVRLLRLFTFHDRRRRNIPFTIFSALRRVKEETESGSNTEIRGPR